MAGSLTRVGVLRNPRSHGNQGEDAEHNTATALYEYLTELSAHLSGE